VKTIILTLMLCLTSISIHANICPLDKEVKAMFFNGEAFERQMVDGMLGYCDQYPLKSYWRGYTTNPIRPHVCLCVEINHAKNRKYIWIRNAKSTGIRSQSLVLILLDAEKNEIYRTRLTIPQEGQHGMGSFVSGHPVPKAITDKMLYFRLEGIK